MWYLNRALFTALGFSSLTAKSHKGVCLMTLKVLPQTVCPFKQRNSD